MPQHMKEQMPDLMPAAMYEITSYRKYPEGYVQPRQKAEQVPLLRGDDYGE